MPDPDAARPQLVEQGSRVAELDVHDAAVGPGVGELLEQDLGVVDHEVAVEEEVGALAQRLHDRRADGEVGHEVTVHHVDVEEVGDPADPVDLGPEIGEVGGEDRGRELHRAKARRVRRPRTAPSRRRRSRTNMPSVPAACGSSSAPRP